MAALYFCRDSKETAILERAGIPAPKRAVIRSLQQLKTANNFIIAIFAGIWIISGVVTWAVDIVLVKILGIVMMGCALNGLTIIMHESCHSLLSKNQLVNRWLGFLCGMPGLVSVSAYKSVHIAHHAYVKSQADPDNIENSVPRFVNAHAGYLLVLFIGIYFYLPAVAVVGFRKGNRDVRKKIVLEYLILASTYISLFVLLPFEGILLYWLLPLLVAAQLSNVRGLAEHGFTAGGNEFTATRTVQSHPLVSFFMCNLNHHLEHHLYPGVPWYHLPRVHQVLQEELEKTGASVYPSYIRFLADFFRVIWTQGVIPNGRLLPTHIREELCL